MEIFWVAELVEPFTGESLDLYWNGHTRPGFSAVTTPDLREAWKYRTEERCWQDIKILAPHKRGILEARMHNSEEYDDV